VQDGDEPEQILAHHVRETSSFRTPFVSIAAAAKKTEIKNKKHSTHPTTRRHLMQHKAVREK
jgi:hypothetical protein